MKNRSEDILVMSVVLVGHFNPTIFTPNWLALKKLIRESDAENADIKVIHPEISHFSLSFVDIQVTKDKFQLHCNNQAEFDLAKDLVISIFRFLKETPIAGIGINRHLHHNFKSQKNYTQFGDWLVPHKIWSDVLKNPGLLDLRMVEALDTDNGTKSHITVSPSEMIKNFGVRIQHNYHIELSVINNPSVSQTIMDRWDISNARATEVFNRLLEGYYNLNF